MQTVFVTSFHPHISRNILRTDVLEILRHTHALRVVLVVPDYKKEYFTANFGGANVIVEGVRLYQASRTTRGLFFKKLGLFLFDTGTARLKKRYKYYHEKGLLYFWFSMALGFIGKSFLVRRAVRFLDLKLSPRGFFNESIVRYHPNLIFSTDPQNENDVSLMQDARRAGIPVLAMLRSWDNVTQRILRLLPDRLLVGSATLKEEVTALYRYPAEKISTVGNPHYDRYLRGPTKSKQEFFAEFGMDPNKKVILYAPIGDHLVKFNDIDQYVMETLASLGEPRHGRGEQVLVRFPPDEGVRLVDFKKPPNMFFDKPGAAFKDTEFGDREIRREDDDRLINEIYYSDVIVTGPTSISLDAALIDKPVITVNFYPSGGTGDERPSPRHLFDGVFTYQCDHIQRLLKTGGVRHATLRGQFLSDITVYLQNPALDREGRAKIRSLWFSRADGKAGERVAEEILKFL